MKKSPAGAERVSLSRELGDFLIELSIALNRTAMYPQGHPSLDEAAAVVVHHLASLLYERPSLSIGVARKQLVIEGVATDARNPVLRSLAERLHQHHIGAVVFQEGVAPAEVLAALRVLAREREKEGQPLGLGHPSQLEVGPHVRLYPLTFERLELVGKAEDEEADEDDPNRASRVGSLWIGLARAALAAGDDQVESAKLEPAAVAEAINEHPAAQAYDQVIVGYLLQIANDLKREGGAASAAVRRRMSKLIAGLKDDTLSRLVEMGGDEEQRRRFVLDAVDGLAADAVVDLVKAAASASSRSVSESMLRILQKLSVHAGPTEGAQTRADVALRDQIRRLVTGWSLDDPNPEGYTFALKSMASTRQSIISLPDQYPPEPMRMMQMALELGAAGPGLLKAAEELLSAGRMGEIVRLLDTQDRNEATESIWRLLSQPAQILAMLAREPVDFTLLDRILVRTDPVAVARAMLDALEDEDSHIARSTLVRALGRLGPEVGVEAARRLSDQRPRVVRAVLALMNELEIVPTGVSPMMHARHYDALVRREALLLATRIPADRERAIGLALTDADERVVRVGVRAAQSGVPEGVVALIARRAGDVKLPMDLRVHLVRALAGLRSPLVLEALLRVTTAGTTFLGRPRLAQRSPEMIAALGVLAEHWQSDRKASAVRRRALRSGDPDLRAAAKADG